MDEAFEKLKKEGKNNVDNLVKWMKDSKIIDQEKATEDKAKALFNDAANKNSVELEKFKEVLAKLASEQNKTVEEFSKSLAAGGQQVMAAFGAAASALSDAMKK